jgi:hypothetical protein
MLSKDMFLERLAIVASLGFLAVAACTVVNATPTVSRPTMPPPSGALVDASVPSASALPSEAGAGGRVQVVVKRAAGALDTESSAAFQAAGPHLEHCHPGNAGKVEVRITKQDRATHLHIEPGASLDPVEGHCVLEALSTVDLEETGGNVGGPAVKPSGFTSLITISW